MYPFTHVVIRSCEENDFLLSKFLECHLGTSKLQNSIARMMDHSAFRRADFVR